MFFFFSSTDTPREFDPDEFLETLSKLKQEEPPHRNPSPPLEGHIRFCPVHPDQALERRDTDTQWGHWEYFKCPIKGCFVSCGVQDVTNYLDSVKRQLHEFYYRPNPDKMRCHCCNPLALTTSHTEKTPGDYSSSATGERVLSCSGRIKTPGDRTEPG